MELALLTDMVVILGLSVLIVLAFQQMKLPPILGFLLVGTIAGPTGFDLIQSSHEVEILAEIGIVFLLFVIGIEFSIKGLLSMKKVVLLGGALQVVGTITIVAITVYWGGLSMESAIFLGMLISLSSTAIVLKILQEKGELTTPYGRINVAILIFQDIAVVLMLLLIPFLAGELTLSGVSLLLLVSKLIIIVAIIIIMARYLVPVLFSHVIKTKSKELFILTVVVLCFATACITAYADLSLALGAFFAGLIISESDYSHQATANILPFREIFISFFFVSVGMLLDLPFFFSHLLMISLLTAGVFLFKTLIIWLTVILLKYPSKTALLSALSLFQVGEFAFLLAANGMQYKLLSPDTYQYFLAVSIITMAITPFVIDYSPNLTNRLLSAPLPTPVRRRLKALQQIKLSEQKREEQQLNDHIVIIGYGINGENVSKAARKAQLPYVIVELDPEVVMTARQNKEPVVFGDAENDLILHHVQMHKARVAVIAISSPKTTQHIIKRIRQFSQEVCIIVRTRYIKEIEECLRLGADQVIPEEFETSIEIFVRVLDKYLIPFDKVQEFVNSIRSSNYAALRASYNNGEDNSLTKFNIPEMRISTLQVQQGPNEIVGKPIHSAGIRANYGITILAIRRQGNYITQIEASTTIEQDDILYVFGKPDNISILNKYLQFYY
ncbi:cation:proton antiporter [Limibacter armeniacum]|uniref:cation:proton antiporter domain-containing protein n=1 Tax=Limibacter armeniacum TaxID=466084 RepID=UPI002FE5BC8A